MSRVHAPVTRFSRVNVLIEFERKMDKELGVLPKRIRMLGQKLTMGLSRMAIDQLSGNVEKWVRVKMMYVQI